MEIMDKLKRLLSTKTLGNDDKAKIYNFITELNSLLQSKDAEIMQYRNKLIEKPYSKETNILCKQIAQLESDIADHIRWNENHTKRIVEQHEQIKQLKAELAMYKQEAKKIPNECSQIGMWGECNGGVNGCPHTCPKYKEEQNNG